MTEKNKVIIDTNVLMDCRDDLALFGKYSERGILVSIGTLEELDRLKTAPGERGFKARNAIRILKKQKGNYNVVLNGTLDLTKVDHQIIYHARAENHDVLTNDISMEMVSEANGVTTKNYTDPTKIFGDGFIEIPAEEFYGHKQLSHNLLNSLIEKYDIQESQYIITYIDNMPEIFFNSPGGNLETVDKNEKIVSTMFGTLEAKDVYQVCAIDSLINNDITVITGPAGTGKTMLALGRQFQMLEEGEINQITIIYNPTLAAGSGEMGFNKGDRTAKILQESLGGILTSKLGRREKVEEMIEDETLVLLPIGNARGYEVPETSSLYITEAQNMTVELMQLAVQRAGVGTKIFIEGDPTSQLDNWKFEGSNNGMLRLINTFKGTTGFGHVDLKEIYRSEIAERAEQMTK